MTTTDKAIIAALGGSSAVHALVSDRLGVTITREAVSMWYHRGIPWRYRHVIQDEAETLGIDLPPDFIEKKRVA